ncbi:MAG: GntR family transcriptional regulator [Pseudomonadota bacterium]
MHFSEQTLKKKTRHWKEDAPIYRQITDLIVERILDDEYAEGELLPSVRQLAEDFDVSTLTAAKVFQELSKENITTKRRGIGAEVRKGVKNRILEKERKKFYEQEMPVLMKRLARLGIDPEELLRKRRS